MTFKMNIVFNKAKIGTQTWFLHSNACTSRIINATSEPVCCRSVWNKATLAAPLPMHYSKLTCNLEFRTHALMTKWCNRFRPKSVKLRLSAKTIVQRNRLHHSCIVAFECITPYILQPIKYLHLWFPKCPFRSSAGRFDLLIEYSLIMGDLTKSTKNR